MAISKVYVALKVYVAQWVCSCGTMNVSVRRKCRSCDGPVDVTKVDEMPAWEAYKLGQRVKGVLEIHEETGTPPSGDGEDPPIRRAAGGGGS